jgi:Fur family transcriptional regulator, ferric uptake regulator
MQPSNKFRSTLQRKIILDELRKTSTHPTADELYLLVKKIIPDISLGTVYRNLELFSQRGIIKKLEYKGDKKRFDGSEEHHYHIRCVVCQRVSDIPASFVETPDYSTLSVCGYKITDHTLSFDGICEKCRSHTAGKRGKGIQEVNNLQ